MRFSGTISARLDGKGRVFLPSAFRKALPQAEVAFVLKRDPWQPCLTLYPADVWEEEVAELRARVNRWNPAQAMVLRQFMAEAEPMRLDANGRLLLTRKHQAHIELADATVCFVGVDDRIEVWAGQKSDEPFMDPADFARQLTALMATPGAGGPQPQ